MSYGRTIAGIAILVALPVLAVADLPCPAAEAEAVAAAPLSAAAIVDLMLPTFLKNGISILFLGALTVVGVPWTIAGLAFALFAFPTTRNPR